MNSISDLQNQLYNKDSQLSNQLSILQEITESALKEASLIFSNEYGINEKIINMSEKIS